MHSTPNESELIREIENLSVQGFTLLYDRYATLLYKIIWITVKDHQLATQLLEETFLVICSDIHEFPLQNLRFTLWMAGIAKQTALRAIRNAAPEFIPEDLPDLPEPDIQLAF
jgi:DNA-directed RNA polymerase specialized sigma24 family protein